MRGRPLTQYLHIRAMSPVPKLGCACASLCSYILHVRCYNHLSETQNCMMGELLGCLLVSVIRSWTLVDP